MRNTLITLFVIQVLLIIAKLAGWSLGWFFILFPIILLLACFLIVIITLIIANIVVKDDYNRDDYE